VPGVGQRGPAPAADRDLSPALVELRNIGDDVLRVLGTFSSSTVVSTFERPFEPGGPQVLVIGSPVPMAAPLEEAVPA
jgi:hypothetical protein